MGYKEQRHKVWNFIKRFNWTLIAGIVVSRLYGGCFYATYLYSE